MSIPKNFGWLGPLLCTGIQLICAEPNLKVVVITGEPAPDGNGKFATVLAPVINQSGQVAFRGTLSETSNGNEDNSGIFRGDGVSLKRIARSGQSVPDGNGLLSFDINYPAINASGGVGFWSMISVPGGSMAEGIFTGDGNSLIQVARTGQPASQVGTNKFRQFIAVNNSEPAINLNKDGQLVFTAYLDHGAQGIFRWDGTNILEIARAYDPGTVCDMVLL